MAQQYRVDKLYGSDEWQSNFGPMIGWKLGVTNLATNSTGYAEINSKPERPYKVGDVFWADVTGERAGVPKLKRAQPPQDGGGQRAGGSGWPGSGGGSSGPARGGPAQQNGSGRQGKPYAQALAAFRQFAADLETPEQATSMFIAWLRGDVADPTTSGDRPEPEAGNEGAPSGPWPDDSESPF